MSAVVTCVSALWAYEPLANVDLHGLNKEVDSSQVPVAAEEDDLPVLKKATSADDTAGLTVIEARGQIAWIPTATPAIAVHHWLLERAPPIRILNLPCFTISRLICARLARGHQDVFDREVMYKQGLLSFGRRSGILRNGRGLEQIGGDGRELRRGVLRE
jgi:hypothetical protein